MKKELYDALCVIREECRCYDEDCGGCPLLLEGQGCAIRYGSPDMWEMEKKLEEDEGGGESDAPKYKVKMDEAEGDFALPRMAEVWKAKATLENHCAGMECDCCPLWREDTWRCTVGIPEMWKLNSEEQPETKEEPKPSFTPDEKRKRVLDDAIDVVCRDRCEMYGEVEDNFGVIAELWNTYLNAGMPEGSCKVDLGARQVAEMMILFKVGRAATAMEEHRDTYVDIAGYAACAGGMCDE